MQFYIILASVCIGFCKCWESGHSYLFHYSGLAETGLLDTEVGNSIKVAGNVLVQVPIPDLLMIQLKDVEGYKCDRNLSTCQALHKTGAAPTDALSMEEPSFMSFKDGKVTGFLESRGTNSFAGFQKAIVSMLKGIPLHSLKGNMQIPNSYKLIEDEITGVCENTYEISRLPSDVIKSDRKLASVAAELCDSDAAYLEILKIRDFDQCTRVPTYNVFTPAGWRCDLTTASCQSSVMRSLMQRSLVCANAKKMVVLQSHLAEDLHSAVFGAAMQKFYSKISQSMKLVRKDRLRHHPAIPNHRFANLHLSEFIQGSATCRETTLDILKVLAETLFNPRNLTDGVFHQNYERLQDCLKTLDDEQRYLSIAGDIKEHARSTEWSLFLDVMVSTGTSTAVKVLKHLLETSKVSKDDALHLLSVLPSYLQSASSETLTTLLGFLEVPLVRKHRDLRQTAFVTLAMIYRLACVDKRMWEVRFPVYMEPVNCTGENGVSVTENFVMYLTRYLRHNSTTGDKMAALSAYNTVGHRSILPIVIPIIEGKLDPNPSIRTKGMLTLHKLSHAGNTDAIRILYTVFANPSENYQVRMAAFTLLMLSNPSEALWQSIALGTWFEPRVHVTSFVYTTLETLARFQTPVSFLRNLSDKARGVLPLARQPARGLHLSANYIWSWLNAREEISAYLRLETFANKASLIPKDLYGRLNWNLGPMDFDFLEFDVDNHRLEYALYKLLDGRVYQAPEQNSTLRRLFKLLRIKEHEKTPAEGFMRWFLMESVERYHSFDGTYLESLIESIGLNRGSINYSRHHMEFYNLWPLVNINVILQNSMGFLTEVRVQGKLITTINGHIKIQTQMDGRKAFTAALNPTNYLQLDSFLQIKSSHLPEIHIRTGMAVQYFSSLPGSASFDQTQDGSARFLWSLPNQEEPVPVYKRRICPYRLDHVDDGPVWHCDLMRRRDEESQWSEQLWRDFPASIMAAVSFFWLPTWDNIGLNELTLQPRSGAKQLEISVQKGRFGERRWSIGFGTNRTSFDFFMDVWPGRVEGSGTLKYSATQSISQDFQVCFLLASDRPSTANVPKHSVPNCANVIIGQFTENAVDDPNWYGLNIDILHDGEVPSDLRHPLAFLKRIVQKVSQWEYLSESNDKNLRVTIRENQHPLASLHVNVPLERRLLGTNYSLKQEILNYLMGGHYTADCSLDWKGHVTTFDGVAYPGNLLTGCKYLVMAATGDVPNFALLMRSNEFKQTMVELVLPEDEIRVSVPDMGVTVNRIKIDLEHRGSFSLESRCRDNRQVCASQTIIQQTQPGAILIDSQREAVRITISNDGLRITARASLRNKVQGLCGDLNEEKLFEMRGPRRCVLSSGALLSAAYALADPSLHCNIPKEIKKQLQLEQQHCPKHEGFPTSLRSFRHP